MIAKPSIAFNDFSGTAKDVTARSVNGRNVLSVRAYQNKVTTPLQAVSRNNLSKISRAYKQLSDSQMSAWAVLSEHLKGISTFGKPAEMTAHNAFVRINSNRALVGMPLLVDAPLYGSDVPEPDYDDFWVTSDRLVFIGIEQPKDTYRLVLRMGAAQSNGVSAGWGNLVIISSDLVPDWGEVDAFELYTNRLGLEPIEGQKYFIEMYWMDTETGFTGESVCVSTICGPKSHVHEEEFRERNVITEDNLVYDSSIKEISYDVEAVPGSALLFIDIKFDITGYVMGVSGNLKEEQNVIPTGSYYSFARGTGDRAFSIAHMEVRVSSDSYQIAGREGSWDKKAEVFGVVCWARR